MRAILALALGFLAAGTSGAQEREPGRIPLAEVSPAYRHFLRSPYSFRTFSTSSPGYVSERITPFGIDTTFVEPGYHHQRITPKGVEGLSLVPGRGRISSTPAGTLYRYTPGSVQQYFVPPTRLMP